MFRAGHLTALGLAFALIAGCSTVQPLPPAVYEAGALTPFEALAPELKTVDTDIVYVTDRAPETGADGRFDYGTGRSRSLAFGSARVSLSGDATWPELVAWTRSEPGAGPEPRPVLKEIREIGRFPPTPLPRDIGPDGTSIDSPELVAAGERAAEQLRAEIRRRLALAPRKSVSVVVHGNQNSFAEAVSNNAVMWHLAGRSAVAITYSWPAGGSGGLVRGYTYDRESGEFTIFHLKEFLRLLAGMPEVETIMLAAHSRGTDILTSALRELAIESRARGEDPREALRITPLVLAAPDMDLDVTSQRFTAERLSESVGEVVVYTSARDSAIGAAGSLFGSRYRVGKLTPEDLSERSRGNIAHKDRFSLVFYTGTQGGRFGHSYYRAPAVQADVALVIRGLPPGAEYGRPLEPIGDNLWTIGDDYLK